MTLQDFLSSNSNPIVYLFSDVDELGSSFISSLTKINCRVLVINDGDKKENNSEFNENPNVYFVSINENIPVSYLGYLICLDPYLHKSSDELSLIQKILPLVSNKKFFIFPLRIKKDRSEYYYEFVRNVESVDQDAQFIYYGDIVSVKYFDRPLSPPDQVLEKILNSSVFNYSEGLGKVYLTCSETIAKETCRLLFSFGLTEKKNSLLPEGLTNEEFNNLVEKIFPDCKKMLSPFIPDQEIIVSQSLKIEENAESIILRKTGEFKSRKTLQPAPKPLIDKPIPLKTKVKKENKKNYLGIGKIKNSKKTKGKFRVWPIFVFIGLVLLPFLLVILSLVFSYQGYSFFKNGKIGEAKTMLVIGNGLGEFNEKIIRFYGFVPGITNFLKTPESLANFSKNSSGLLIRGINASESLSLLLNGVFGEEPFKVTDIAEELVGELDYLYVQSGFLKGELDSYPTVVQNLIVNKISFSQIDLYREKLINAKALLYYLPDILGQFTPRTYLVLLQNNMELRPTGGFIGSVALVKLDQGRLIDVSVQDVYSLDGQLKGYVEPPEPLVKYLNQPNWYLRDSNWDPDFPTSAIKAQWFLDKEVNQKVDGVVGIDLEVVKDFLSTFGPINLTDYQQTITKDNFYEITQSQVEEDFFPGSTKKTSFLTALSRQLLTNMVDNINKAKFSTMFSLYKNLDEKHMQLYFNNPEAQNVITKLNFDGGVEKTNCVGNCYSDWVGYVDSNLGVNKANFYIKRSANLTSYIDSQKILRYLTVDIRNDGNPVLGDKVIYKTFFRVLVPPNSLMFKAKLGPPENLSEVSVLEYTTGKYKEAGVWVEVGPKETKRIIFSWQGNVNLNFDGTGFYQVAVRKQAGTLADPFALSVFLPNNLTVQNTNEFTLTKEGFYLYNTTLAKDIFPRIYWLD